MNAAAASSDTKAVSTGWSARSDVNTTARTTTVTNSAAAPVTATRAAVGRRRRSLVTGGQSFLGWENGP